MLSSPDQASNGPVLSSSKLHLYNYGKEFIVSYCTESMLLHSHCNCQLLQSSFQDTQWSQIVGIYGQCGVSNFLPGHKVIMPKFFRPALIYTHTLTGTD